MDMRESKERALEPKETISSNFKALEIGLLNLKGFQDAYEPRSENIRVNYM